MPSSSTTHPSSAATRIRNTLAASSRDSCTGERRNTENIAQALQGGPVRSLQAFITTGAWDDVPLLELLRRDALDVLADDDDVWNSDETGFAKKGKHSVGVARQYSGTLGRTDNCQVAVFANYCSTKGHTFMDRRLFLPKEWTDDPDRCAAGVPVGVIFRTKPALALEMVANAVAARVPFRWVGGDSVYGDNPTFVQGVRALGKWYVLDIACDTLVWTEEPEVIAAEDRLRPPRGRPPSKPLVVGERQRVDAIIAALPAMAWRRVTVGEGSQGPLQRLRGVHPGKSSFWFRQWFHFSPSSSPSPDLRM